MTSKTWSFDKALFRRDLRRTAPLWLLYILAAILLLPVLALGNISPHASSVEQARQLTNAIYTSAHVFSSVGAAIYGGLLAWTLWFSLFQTKSAYFYAALPVSRESQFLTHYLSGLTVTLVPNVLVFGFTLAASYVKGLPMTEPCLIWLAVSTLSFLFFYGFATLCSMASGQVAAMPVLYLILNFVFVVVESIVRVLLESFVFGLPRIGSDYITKRLSPLYYMLIDNNGMYGVDHIYYETTVDGAVYSEISGYVFRGLPYLAILAVVGLAFAVLALLLFRKREMERCGDVICVRWLRPVFQYAFTLGCALVLSQLIKSIVGRRTFSYNFSAVFVLLLVGAFIGHVVARMLLHKTIRVFRSGWWSLLICCAVLTLTFGSMRLDLFGYSAHIPDRVQVAAVSLQRSSAREMVYPVEDPEIIDQTLAIHQQFLDHRSRIEADASRDYLDEITIGYQLADGGTLYRTFELPIFEPGEDTTPGSLQYDLDQVYNSVPCILARELPSTDLTAKNMLSCTIYHEVYSEYIDEKTGEDVYVKTDEDIYVGEAASVDVAAIGPATDPLTLGSEEAWKLYSTAILPDLLDSCLGYSSFPIDRDLYPHDESFSLEFAYHDPPEEKRAEAGYADDVTNAHYVSFRVTTDARRTIEFLKDLGYEIDF